MTESTLGDRIRSERKAAGLTQKQLALKIGVAASMIAQWETNIRNPKFKTVEKIASALNIATLDLLGDTQSDMQGMNKNRLLGTALKRLREHNGLSQSSVANMLGMKSKSTVCMWETGSTLPDVFTLLELCRIYGVSEAQPLVEVLNLISTVGITCESFRKYSYCPFCGKKLP